MAVFLSNHSRYTFITKRKMTRIYELQFNKQMVMLFDISEIKGRYL
jgi:hypothetical protein